MKFQPGDVVKLKSAMHDGAPSCTVLVARPAVPDGEEFDLGRGAIKGPAPATYELAVMPRDGSTLVTFNLPEHALVAVEPVS